MSCIILWCNANGGFLTAIQTLFTLILGICAIYVSVKIYHLQTRPDLKIYPVLLDDIQGNTTLELYVYNKGNVPVYLKCIRAYRVQSMSEEPTEFVACIIPNETANAAFLVQKNFETYCMTLENCEPNDSENQYLRVEIDVEEKTFVFVECWAYG